LVVEVSDTRFLTSLVFLAVLAIDVWCWQANHSPSRVVECTAMRICVVSDARNQDVWVVGADVPGLHMDPRA
jgi:hypothetical protein